MADPTYTRVKLEIAGLGGPLGGVDVAPDGATYIADQGNDRIVKIAAGATTYEPLALPGLKKPYGLKVTDDGRIIVADNGGHRVARFDLDTGAREDLVIPGVTWPTDIEMDAEGRILVVDGTRDGQLHRIDLDGISAPLSASKVTSMHGIALAPDGTIFVTVRSTEDYAVLTFAPEGGEPQVFSRSVFLDAPAGIEVDADGIVYVANAGQQTGKSSRLLRFAPDGDMLDPIITCDPHQFGQYPAVMRPIGIALAPAGDIVVVGYQPEAVRLVRN